MEVHCQSGPKPCRNRDQNRDQFRAGG